MSNRVICCSQSAQLPQQNSIDGVAYATEIFLFVLDAGSRSSPRLVLGGFSFCLELFLGLQVAWSSDSIPTPRLCQAVSLQNFEKIDICCFTTQSVVFYCNSPGRLRECYKTHEYPIYSTFSTYPNTPHHPPKPLQTTDPFIITTVLSLPECHVSGTIQYVTLSDQLLSWIKMYLRFIKTFPGLNSFLQQLNNIPLFIH